MNSTLSRTLVGLLTAAVLKMQIVGNTSCEKQPCKRKLCNLLTDKLSATFVYIAGNELNYCLNSMVRLQQVKRHSIQLTEYK